MNQTQRLSSVLDAAAPGTRLGWLGVFALLDGLHRVEDKILSAGLF